MHAQDHAHELAQDALSENDEDMDATPKILSRPQLEPVGNTYSRLPLSDANLNSENPALRLRAILAHGKPNTGNVSKSQVPPTPSDVESDFDIPSDTGTSLARETLSAIFSRAKRPPGNTPRKSSGLWRRNSIDASEVEESPRMLSMLRERARIKGKRQSMSDEEAEKLSSACFIDVVFVTTTFFLFLQRLLRTQKSPSDLQPPRSMRYASGFNLL